MCNPKADKPYSRVNTDTNYNPSPPYVLPVVPYTTETVLGPLQLSMGCGMKKNLKELQRVISCTFPCSPLFGRKCYRNNVCCGDGNHRLSHISFLFDIIMLLLISYQMKTMIRIKFTAFHEWPHVQGMTILLYKYPWSKQRYKVLSSVGVLSTGRTGVLDQIV